MQEDYEDVESFGYYEELDRYDGSMDCDFDSSMAGTDEDYEDVESFGHYEELDDSMDGDFDSAMTSAGFGTDEDYGFYGYELD